jgi:hypothetical protein
MKKKKKRRKGKEKKRKEEEKRSGSLSLGDDVMYYVMDEKFLAVVWLKLKSWYMSKLLMNNLYLK